MIIGTVRSLLGRYFTSYNRAAGPKVFLYAMALGLAVVVQAQPFPSFLLDTGYVVGPDQVGVLCPAVAISDSTGLVVWHSDGHVKGCLTTSGRTSSSTACIDISGPNETFSTAALDVGKSPSGYLVAWSGDLRKTLRGALVSLNGEVVMRETLAYYTEGFPMERPAVAFDGTNYLVAWDEEHYTTRWVMCARVSQAGQVLDWPPIKVCPAGDAQSYVSLSFGDSCYLAAYWYWVPGKSDYGIRCSRILPTGVVLDSAGIPVRHWPESHTFSRGGNSSVAFDGQYFVVSWFEQSAPFELRAARVTQSGVVLDTEGLVVGTSPLAPTGVSTASVCDTTFLVWYRLWEDTAAISGRRLSGDGGLLDTSDIFITPPVCTNHGSHHPRGGTISQCGDDFLVVYIDYAASSGAEYGAPEALSRRVSVAGQVLDTVGTLLSYAANYQTTADVASDGENYLVVWTDLRTGASSHDCAVYGMRFSNEGSALDRTSFRISQWASHAPRVAYGAGCYLVTWLTDFGEDSSQVWAARVGRDGAPLDSNPIRIPGLVFDYVDGGPDVAFGDSLFLVVWHSGGTGCAGGARVRADGSLLDSTPIRLETNHGWVSNFPRVAADGHDFLVVWDNVATRRVCGLRVGSSGQLLDTAAIIMGRGGGTDYTPAVAFGEGVYLVVEPSSANRAWRVTQTGAVLDTIPLDPAPYFPQVTYDGTNFFLVEGFWSSAGLVHAYLAIRISPQGEVIDSAKLDVIDLRPDSTYAPEVSFGLTADLQGHVGMAFPAYQSNPYVSRRIRAAAFPAVVGGINEQASSMPQVRLSARITRSTVPFVVSEPAALYDIAGRKLRDLVPGSHDMSGCRPGVYLLRLKARAAVTKVVVVE